MKYNFTITLTIAGELLDGALKSIADDIQATLKASNDEVGLGWSDKNGESFYADTIDVKYA